MSATGRHYVRTKDGRLFCVEAIDPNVGRKKLWGDMDPVTKKFTGSYGNKYPGAIHPKDSFIKEENGFKNIITLPPGHSPMGYIQSLISKGDAWIEDQGKI